MTPEFTPAPRASEPPAPRASDQDRERAAAQVQEAHGDGRLDLEELDERLTRIYQAKTRQELVHVTADLVPAEPDGPVGHGGQSDVLALRVKHSAEKRVGKWQVPPRITARIEHSSIKLDFSEAVLRSPQVRVEAEVKHGSLLMIVPPGWIIDVDQIESTGGAVENKAGEPKAGAPRLQVVGTAKYSSITVRHPRRQRWWWPWR
ncbi:DUF1707 SHOCT-like domain-containing protein [Kribbella deserti]|uniref:DUF1707 domain-containing protein n=1 Tax=Kribbella deserti TaxID=1926257 RepID=A0ABV6QKR8_9ACTN